MKTIRIGAFGCPLILGALLALPLTVSAESAGRRIEEVVVTAEKVESTVSDTSISITAFDSRMIEELGLQSADELVNFIPATTRDAYDIRIRGVGRNFRALGGDPGVATYYNGVYSPDFGIAASENALYDLERVEVLRGPQGTLYGRNSIGGALNYITKRPSMDMEGEIRTQFGKYRTAEFYGVISGPIIEDKLAARLVGVKRDRDGHQKSLSESPDTDSIDDRNLSLALLWRVTDTMEWNVRANDRKSDRIIPGGVLMDMGPGPDRSSSSYQNGVNGLMCNPSRPIVFDPNDPDDPDDDQTWGECQAGAPQVDASWPGAMAFSNPAGSEISGDTVYGAYNRPGLDPTGWPYQPNSFYMTDPSLRPLGLSLKNPRNETQVNDDGVECRDFPYTDCNFNHELFEHRSLQSDFTWDINEKLALTYIFGYTDFDYTFNQDLDNTDVDFTKYRQTVLEDVWNYSHELQLNWSLGENFSATSGLYYFRERRNQDYSLSNTTSRYTEAADYGGLDDPNPFLPILDADGNVIGLGASITDYFCGPSIEQRGSCSHVGLWSAPVGQSYYGLWGGDERGDVYHHENTVRNEAIAIYTQGTYQFNDQWALVLGIRYAEDKKEAQEVRGGYLEDTLPWTCPPEFAGDPTYVNCFIGLVDGTQFIQPGWFGQTQLGAINAAMGNAVVTFDPSNPIAAVCATPDDPTGLTNPNCSNPLRLGGMPLSWTSSVRDNDKWSDTNFRINIDWTPTDDILMYASFTTGYRAGGYQLGVTDARDQQRDALGLPVPGTEITPLTYDKETVEAVEIGYKGTHFDGTLQLNMSVYQYTYDNYQDRLNVFDPVRNRGVDIVQNANGVINRGFEVETLWLATERLTLGGNYSYTDAFYDDDYYVVEEDNPDLPPSLFGSPTTNPDLFVRNVKGDQLKRIPEHKATVWGSYDIPTSLGNWQLRADYSYTGKFGDSGITRYLDEIPARHRVNAAIIWEDLRRRWSVRGFVDNLTNEKNIRGVGTASESDNWALTGAILYPQYWGIDVRFRFGQ